ncbi:DUF6105 family protein [Rhizobium sp.]|jgi:hypothetical protein|uniref:DUF6105 family protein n=1 Tax=Rhizobium sp. TaxID=391 RepID=UPI000E834E0C|nr:hypothetical protein [Rhizobium sp.]
MKSLVTFWALPILILGVWYYLSLHDINFGFFILTRKAHDLVFATYGAFLGIAPEALPRLVMRAIVLDSALLFGILATRRRRKIVAWFREKPLQSVDASADNLSSAP